MNLFPVIKSLSISLVGKTFNHSTAVNKRLQCIVKKALFLFFFKVSIDHLFGDFEAGKITDCFGKVQKMS